MEGDKDRARVQEVEETPKGVLEAHDKLQAEGKQAKEELKKHQLTHSKLKTAA